MRRPRTTWSLAGVLTALLALVLTALVAGPVAAAPAAPPGGAVDLGPNVKVFDPSMPTAAIQAAADAVYAQQVDEEMGDGRYALLFKPGVYGSAQTPLNIKVGYYTEVAGLGAFPGSVVINGHVEVYNRCFPDGQCFALNNFWRSLSNLTINVTGGEGCRSGTNFWAVSQASPMRRVDVQGGNLSLMDYCGPGPQFASGGFMADSRAGVVINGSQQQWVTRNSQVGTWTNAVWNQVFAGVQGAPAQSFPDPPYTTLDQNPVGRERPYLWVDNTGTWQVFVPAARFNSTGPSWTAGPVQGRSIPLSEFTIASPSSNWSLVNAALAQGRNVLLLPGRYDAAKALVVKRANTVVLGLGLPSITPTKGNAAIEVDNVPGVVIAGLTVDAGPRNSSVLMRIGTGSRGPVQDAKASDPANPTALSDVFFRIGGPQLGKATVALEVNSNDVVLDDIWAWRADHGTGVGWTSNTSDTGVVVNGNDVTATGLFSEHFQKDNVIWSGERGRTIFFQNELPYDAPNQAAWQHDGILGYAGYKVADTVKNHELWGGGSYIFTNVDPTLHATHGFEVPLTPGVKLHDLVTVSLNQAGTIDHIVNDVGPAVGPNPDGGSTIAYLPEYPLPTP
ncbi:MAG TPA: adenylyl cyclase [Lapillicoccus sp.]|nr:adenylyl cyclase [Lapillicoccus sp.]